MPLAASRRRLGGRHRFTRPLDRSTTYLHILNPHEGRRLLIGMPANGARFSKATLMPSGKAVKLELTPAGYMITLPDDENWNPVHTAIRLDRP